MTIEGRDIIKVAKQVLSELGVTTFQNLEITYRLKTKTEWQVNFQFKRAYGSTYERGCFAVNSDTGEIVFAGLNRQYQ